MDIILSHKEAQEVTDMGRSTLSTYIERYLRKPRPGQGGSYDITPFDCVLVLFAQELVTSNMKFKQDDVAMIVKCVRAASLHWPIMNPRATDWTDPKYHVVIDRRIIKKPKQVGPLDHPYEDVFTVHLGGVDEDDFDENLMLKLPAPKPRTRFSWQRDTLDVGIGHIIIAVWAKVGAITGEWLPKRKRS